MKFELVNTQEKLDQWRAFAKTFDHDTDRPTLPLVTITDGDYMIGHFSELAQPIVFPAFHPSISKRQFRDAVEFISHSYFMKSMSPSYPNGVLFTALPKDLPIDHSEKMGFKDLGVNLYERLP